MIQICDIDYIPQAGYPKLSGQAGDESIVVEWLERNPVLPDYWTAFFDSRYPLFSAFTHLTLRKRDCEPLGTDLFRIRCEYSDDGGDGTSISMGGGVTTVSTVTNEAVDVPLAQHPNYLTKWNHELHGRGSVYTSSWVDTATDTVIDPTLVQDYAWAKPGTVPADGWHVIMAATKPGVESYLAFLPVVHVVRTARKTKLTRTMALDGTIQTPPDVFGCTTLQWLQVGSSLVQQGGLWQLTTDYRGSLVIDPDLYV